MSIVEYIQDSLKQTLSSWLMLTSPASVRYVSEFSGSDAILLISSSSKSYILIDGRYVTQAEQQAKGFEVVKCEEGLINQLAKFDIKAMGYESKHMSVKRFKQITDLIPFAALVDMSYIIDDVRQIKTEEEIKKLRKAAQISDRTFSYIKKYIRNGMTERQVALEIEYNMRRQGATGTSFDTIVASGPNSSMPHAKLSSRVIQNGDFVLLDYGCVCDGYCSDMSRTIGIGSLTDKQKEIYNIVESAQRKVLESVKAGMTGRRADSIARRIIEDAGYGDNFTHSLGHGIGLDVHENPRLSTKSDERLRPGMVVSIEPGIYLPDEFGVRIEDVVVIGESGIENLTSSSKELIIINEK